MKKILFIVIASYFLLLLGCGENDSLYYSGEPDGTSGIYFSYSSGTTTSGNGVTTYKYRDTTLEQSLANVVDSILQVRVPVRLFGEVSDRYRAYVVKVVGGTAREGEDYTMPDNFVLEGGTAVSYVTVNLKKTDKLLDGAVRYLTLGLEENDNFKLYIKSLMVGTDTITTQFLTIPFSMIYQEPWTWRSFALDKLGEYSHAKLMCILSVMGWTYSEFNQKNLYTVSPAIAMFMQIELQKRANEGNPVLEADGSFMQLAGSYLVDYSAYE